MKKELVWGTALDDRDMLPYKVPPQKDSGNQNSQRNAPKKSGTGKKKQLSCREGGRNTALFISHSISCQNMVCCRYWERWEDCENQQ